MVCQGSMRVQGNFFLGLKGLGGLRNFWGLEVL